MGNAETFFFGVLALIVIFTVLAFIQKHFVPLNRRTIVEIYDVDVLFGQIESACAWSEQFELAIEKRLASGKWLDSEFRDEQRKCKPENPIKYPEFAIHLNALPNDIQQRWNENKGIFCSDIDEHCRKLNEVLWKLEIERSGILFDTVESQPLTYEQRAAATCFENRLQVIASAGSGKTSVMVAKAAYVVSRGLVQSDRVLMLAFNKAAAEELAKRTKSAFKRAGLSTEGLRVDTFHAYGLSAIGEVTGSKPRLAPWAETEAKMINRSQILVARLRKIDPLFAINWFLLKTVYFRDLGDFGYDNDVEDRDQETKASGKRTLSGDIVRSDEERLIANWLFVHDIKFEYEPNYAHPTATSEFSQYRPDFYYPDIDTYHEHFALDSNGQPPAHFHGYIEGVDWKRRIHSKYQTHLFETTSAEIRGNQPFLRLESLLRSAGLNPQLNLSRVAAKNEPVTDISLIRLFLVVLSHFKSNHMDLSELEARIEAKSNLEGHIRRKIFFSVFRTVYVEWQAELEKANFVDFHDMLVEASKKVSLSKEAKKYDLILVDEFQDTSVARMALVKSLSNRAGVQVTVVGDDWQSINRFAGADLSVMTGFMDVFPQSQTVSLTRTFRCDQDICDMSSRFIMQNPNQQKKTVLGQSRGNHPHIHVQFVDEANLKRSTEEVRRETIQRIIEKEQAKRPKGKFSVFILARYRFELEGLQSPDFGPEINVSVMTIHASKGLEADIVIVVGMNAGTNYGFPSRVNDDPLLSLVMPAPDPYPHSEERRLFYVAATRAKDSLHLISSIHNPSEFVLETQRDYPELIEITGLHDSKINVCPRCQGILVKRTARLSGAEFYGCQNFPRCDYTKSIKNTS